MDYLQILCKTFLKLKVTTIILVMRQHFPQEILKQLDMDYRPSFTWLKKIQDLVHKEIKQVTTLNEFKAKIKIWKLETLPANSVELTFCRQGSLHNAFSHD